jgi:hypothetical protein
MSMAAPKQVRMMPAWIPLRIRKAGVVGATFSGVREARNG